MFLPRLIFIFSLLLALSQIFTLSHAKAAVTHKGKVILDLYTINEKGVSDKIVNKDGTIEINWVDRSCSLKLESRDFPCKLDVTHDLTNAKGELIVKMMPEVHFPQSSIDLLLEFRGEEDKKLKENMWRAVRDSSASRASGFDVPFYTCGIDLCEKTGKDLHLYNVFSSYVERFVPVQSKFLGSVKLNLKFTMKKMDAHGGAFNIIGNNNAGNFNTH